MELTPRKILEDLKAKNLDRRSAVELLISLIENSENDDVRVESIESLLKISVMNNKIFKLLENLLISDSSERVRNAAAKFIKNKFFDKALFPFKWAIQHESAYDCIITILETLAKINNDESKSILIAQIKKIRKKKYLDVDKRIDNKKYKKELKKLFKLRKIEDLTQKESAEIIINYKTITNLTKKFYSVYFELENALVAKLDLADVEYEVRGWKSDFKNNIREISEIIGLKNLKQLTHLNISNNQIKSIKDLTYMKNLTHLYVSNNQIKDVINLEYIKKMPNLKYLDISQNELVFEINRQDFANLEITLKKYYF